MKQDTENTVVVFRVWKQDPCKGEVIALFPYCVWSINDCTSYAHIGQHDGADYTCCIDRTRPAKPAEYAELERELVSIGYNLTIRKRKNRKG